VFSSNLKRLFRLLVPTVLNKYWFWVAEFQRLGMPKWKSLLAATNPTKVAAAGTRELRLLPDGVLRNFAAVVDVGANVGDWSAAVMRVCKFCHLIVVEPAPVLQEILLKRFGKFRNVTLISEALASKRGRMEFHITDDSASASLLSPRSGMNRYYGHGFTAETTCTVPVSTLDDVTAGIDRVSLIKLDVQGYEVQVLKGGIQTVQKCDTIMMEVTFYSYYDGDSSFFVLHQFIAQHGFVLWNLSEPFKVRGAAMWCDAIYRKSDDKALLESV
jgi:FkbM family methyltransferase